VTPAQTLVLSQCRACQTRFLPSDGPCPKCGSTDIAPYHTSAVGRVLAATELHYPSTGWHTPHRLALIEVADAVRVLATVEGPLPVAGALVEVHHDRDIYRAKPEPTH